MIPEFDERGNVPPGVHHATWIEIVSRYATSTHRQGLLDGNHRAAQKARYGGELFPAETAAEPSGTAFLDYFQSDRETGAPKGIVAISLGDLP